jgi:amino acid efflux transporter
VLCYGFSGWEAASHLSAEFTDPRRLLPRVTALTLSVVAVLYCGLAVVTPGVLGSDAATTSVPLTALLARGLGPAAGVVTAVAAVLLTFGAINTYLAGGARLGAALGRDGALPRWFAGGPGPRRGLLALAAMCALLGLVSALWAVDLAALMRVAAACLTAVTAAGTAAAVRLLPPGWLRRCAVLATAATLAVLVCWGPLLLVPAGLGLAAVLRRPRTGETRVTAGVR